MLILAKPIGRLFLMVVLVFAAMPSAWALAGRDIRIVNGIVVDVTPLQNWLAYTNTGERPLPHWRQLRILNAESGIGSYMKAEVIIDGQNRTILLDHFPAEVRKYFTELNRVRNRVVELSQYVEREDKRLKRLDARTPVNVTGDPWYVSVVMSRRARINLDMERLRGRMEELRFLRADYDRLVEASDVYSVDIGMFTGKIYAGMEVWTCGGKR